MPNIYGNLNTAKDVTDINVKIRNSIRKAKSRERLSELVRRSQYLYTLAFSPSVAKGVKNPSAIKERAKMEFHKTACAANKRAAQIGIKGNYDSKIGPGRGTCR